MVRQKFWKRSIYHSVVISVTAAPYNLFSHIYMKNKGSTPKSMQAMIKYSSYKILVSIN